MGWKYRTQLHMLVDGNEAIDMDTMLTKTVSNEKYLRNEFPS